VDVDHETTDWAPTRDGALSRDETACTKQRLAGDALEIGPPIADWPVIPPDTDVARISAWRRVIAALVYDSRIRPHAVGTRAVASPTGPRHRLHYEADGVEIHLEVRDSTIAGRRRVLGEIDATEPNLHQAWVITEGPSGYLENNVDAFGHFLLDGLVSGVHRMRIGLAYELVEIPAVQID
jgi:hypothetical protein